MTSIPNAITGNYAIDPSHSRMGFVARHAMITKVRGSFTEMEGTGFLDADDPSKSWAKLTIKVDSIDTGNADRDGHIRSSDFVDMENYPEITFESASVRQIDPENYEVTGDLNVKGVTKPVTLEFEYGGTAVDPFNNTRLGFEGKAVVNRKDWGLNWNAALEAGGVLVGEKVTLEIEISAIRLADD